MKAYTSPDIPRGQPPALSAPNAPDHMTVPLELWNFAKSLPKAQRRKVLDAACCIFFDYTFPDDLQPAVISALAGWDGRMVKARRLSFKNRGMTEEEAFSRPESGQEEKNKNFSEESLEKVPNFFENNFPPHTASTGETPKNIGGNPPQIEIEMELSESISRSEPSSDIPTREMVREYVECCEIHEIDPDKFFDHYEKTGWKTKGEKPITDWRGMIRQWRLHEGEITKRQEPKPEHKSKRRLKLFGQESEKGTWIYTGGPNTCDYLKGSENWTREQANAELEKLERELATRSNH